MFPYFFPGDFRQDDTVVDILFVVFLEVAGWLLWKENLDEDGLLI